MASNDFSEMKRDTYQPLRDQYRKMNEDLQDLVDNAGSEGVAIEEVRNQLLLCNDAFMKVKRPREAVLDGKHLKLITQITKTNIESSQASLVKFNPLEFAENLKQFMIPNGKDEDLLKEEPWIKLGEIMSRTNPGTAVGVDPLVAALDVVVPPKPERRVAKNSEVKGILSKKLTQTENPSKDEGETEEVVRVFKVLKRRFRENNNQPVCYYSFVMNPTSFPLTIENIFHVAFLLRDGHAEMTLDNRKLPVLAPSLRGAENNSENQETNQCIISMCMEDWREIIDAFKIKDAMIPPVVRENKRPGSPNQS